MRFNEFVDSLKGHGFTSGDIFTVLSYFVTDLEQVKEEQLKQVIPIFKGAIVQIKEQENLYFEEVYGDKNAE